MDPDSPSLSNTLGTTNGLGWNPISTLVHGMDTGVRDIYTYEFAFKV